MYVICGRGSVLLWRRRNMLCISGFVNDVVFRIIERMIQNHKRRVWFVQFSRWRDRSRCLSSPTASCLLGCYRCRLCAFTLLRLLKRDHFRVSHYIVPCVFPRKIYHSRICGRCTVFHSFTHSKYSIEVPKFKMGHVTPTKPHIEVVCTYAQLMC